MTRRSRWPRSATSASRCAKPDPVLARRGRIRRQRAKSGSDRGTAGDLVGPELAAPADVRGRRAAGPLGLGPVAVPERRRVHPGLERLLVAPAGDDQPGRALVGRLEQLEALEAVLVVDGAGPGGEAAGELVPAV